MKTINCLVTGGAGFIGSHIVDQLIASGHNVTVIDDLSTGKKDNINPQAKFIHANINNAVVFERLEDISYVFHAAAYSDIPSSIEYPEACISTNILGTIRVLDFCRKSGAKIIFSSSCAIYKGNKKPITEGFAKNPLNPYAETKVQAESYLKLYHNLYGLKYASLRYFNVYGERQNQNAISIFQGSEICEINGDGEQTRDYIYVSDVARANIMAMEWNGFFNIGSGKSISVNELTKLIGHDSEHVEARANEIRFIRANIEKAKSKGWRPLTSLENWLSENHR